MKKLVNVAEVSGEGLEALLGQRVMLLCLNYIYVGMLTGVASDCVALESPHIVYETGEWNAKAYSDIQALPCPVLYVSRSAVESFGVSK